MTTFFKKRYRQLKVIFEELYTDQRLTDPEKTSKSKYSTQI